MELTHTLKTFIEEGQDWERKNTSVRGVSIIRLPGNKEQDCISCHRYQPDR